MKYVLHDLVRKNISDRNNKIDEVYQIAHTARN